MNVYLNCPTCSILFSRSKKYYLGRVSDCNHCYCSKACFHQGRRNFYKENLPERFWEKVDKTPGQGRDGDCWEWVGYRDFKNYGKLIYEQRVRSASHISLLLEYGVFNLPPGYEVMHTCDNPPCVNPNHLKIATHAENMQDMVAKGRSNKAVKYSTTKIKNFRVKYDLTGLKIGNLSFIKKIGVREGNGEAIWLAECICGNFSNIDVSQAKYRKMCMKCSIEQFQNTSPDLIGMIFGDLTVISKIGYIGKSKDHYWKCLCRCLKEVVTRTNRLISEEKTACKECTK